MAIKLIKDDYFDNAEMLCIEEDTMIISWDLRNQLINSFDRMNFCLINKTQISLEESIGDLFKKLLLIDINEPELKISDPGFIMTYAGREVVIKQLIKNSHMIRRPPIMITFEDRQQLQDANVKMITMLNNLKHKSADRQDDNIEVVNVASEVVYETNLDELKQSSILGPWNRLNHLAWRMILSISTCGKLKVTIRGRIDPCSKEFSFHVKGTIKLYNHLTYSYACVVMKNTFNHSFKDKDFYFANVDQFKPNEAIIVKIQLDNANE